MFAGNRLQNRNATLSAPNASKSLNMGVYSDSLEYEFPDKSEGNVVVDIDNYDKFPSSLVDMVVGARVDAVDHRGQW